MPPERAPRNRSDAATYDTDVDPTPTGDADPARETTEQLVGAVFMLTEIVTEMKKQLRDGSSIRTSATSLHANDQGAVTTVQDLNNTIAGRRSENWARHAGNCKWLMDNYVELTKTSQDVADAKTLASTPLSSPFEKVRSGQLSAEDMFSQPAEKLRNMLVRLGTARRS